MTKNKTNTTNNIDENIKCEKLPEADILKLIVIQK